MSRHYAWSFDKEGCLARAEGGGKHVVRPFEALLVLQHYIES